MYIGAIFVDKQITHQNGEPYTAGDTQAIFLGIFFGIVALGIGAPNFKALAEGKLNCFSALTIINRIPSILPDDTTSNYH